MPTRVASYDYSSGGWICDDHPYRVFVDRTALNQHLSATQSHNYCFPCECDFPSPHALHQHRMASQAHNYCEQCNCDFPDRDRLYNHFRREHIFCNNCKMIFRSHAELKTHDADNHFYCIPCDRFFESGNNLRAHLNSSKHAPKTISCPFYGCGKQFVSHAAVVLHWEQGTCPSKVTRQLINDYIRKHDVHNVITTPQRMITNGVPGDIEYRATEHAWNGSAYECYLCPQTFSSLTGLNQHLASPRHAQKIYWCRQNGGCGAQFTTLSGLVQHIEARSCNAAIKKSIEGFTRNLRTIAF